MILLREIEFGVRLPVAGPLATRDNLRRVATESERLGFDCLWTHDFVVWTEHLDTAHISCGSLEAVDAARDGGTYTPNFFDSLSTVAFVSGMTESIRIGIAVLCLPFRHPVVAAKQIATIDQLSGGRLILGVGVGAAASTGNKDFEVLGIARQGRYRRTIDYLKAMQEIWSSQLPEYHGEFVDFEQTTLNPKPVQSSLPIWLGGAGPKAIEMTGMFGTGWIPGRLAIDQYPAKVAEIREKAIAAGRDEVDFTIASEIYGCIGGTKSAAHAASARTIEALSTVGGFPQLEAQQAFASHALIGGTEEIIDRIGNMVDVGVSHFEIKFIYQNISHLLDQLEQFSSEVCSKFR